VIVKAQVAQLGLQGVQEKVVKSGIEMEGQVE
jgi:hypothetical protein